MQKKIIFVAVFFLIFSGAVHGSILFSDKKYQKQMEVKSYVMDNVRICSLFSSNKAEQLPLDKITLGQRYLVVRIKNNGNNAIWGQLDCKIDGRAVTSINIPIAPANMDSYSNFVIPLHGIILPKNTGKPEILTKWIKLKSK